MRYGAHYKLIRRGAQLAALLFALSLASCRPPTGTGPVAAPRDRPSPSPAPEADPPPTLAPTPLPADAPHASAALVRIAAEDVAGLSGALLGDRASLLEALDGSLSWFEKPSSHDYFPVGEFTHERSQASVRAFREWVLRVEDGEEFGRRIRESFDLYASIGHDGRGSVLFTGYYSPAFEGSRTEREGYRYPLYRRPDDLVVDPATGEVEGRRIGDRVVTYPTRADIEISGMLAGTELVWLRDKFEAYLIHVQGSAVIMLADGTTMQVGYAGNNGHQYVSVARALVTDGKLADDELSLDEVRGYFEEHPEDLDRYLHRNFRFVFFREDTGSEWPTGSLGVKVTALRSLATDKELFPPAGVVLVVTDGPDSTGRIRRLQQFMLDQDAGGAIRSPGRADIYYGVGQAAESLAGFQYSEGRLYYLFLKPGRVREWR